MENRDEIASARGQYMTLLAIMTAGIAPKGHPFSPKRAEQIVQDAAQYLNLVSSYTDSLLPMPEDGNDDDQA